jgi:aldehyde:ferredoxin oxidoreductase
LVKQRVPSLNGRILRVDLGSGRLEGDDAYMEKMRSYLGGTALGLRYLYDEVGPDVEWSDPENRFFLGAGPLNGTAIGGSGTISAVTVGALSNGPVSSQANGYMGAYLKSAGFDGVLLQGAGDRWRYLYIHDGKAELRDASHLVGKDTWETEELIKQELGYSARQMSVFSIGPAGENLVRFAALVGDRGHVAAHNGLGAVLGSKRLKAVAVARGRARPEVKDPQRLRDISEELWKRCEKTGFYTWGTSWVYSSAEAAGWLPVRNYTTSVFPEHARFMGDDYSSRHQMTRHPCYACRTRHCHMMKLAEGSYAGYEGEEPEYEQWAAFGAGIGNTDVGGAMVLSNEVDRLGMDCNEMGWVLGWVMECYEKELLSRDDLDGLQMDWGNVEAARQLMRNIANRRGFGDALAEGVMHAAQKVGGEAIRFAIYTPKGNSPRSHDHRGRWSEMFDTVVSSTGTYESHLSAMPDLEPYDLPAKVGDFDADMIAEAVARTKGAVQFEDSLVTCRFVTGMHLDLLCQAVEAATGWDFDFQEAFHVGRRAVNIARVFNLRRGIGHELERPSERYGSTPVDGANAGIGIMEHWERMLRIYYENMGWDGEMGVPLAETLRSLGLDDLVADLRK